MRYSLYLAAALAVVTALPAAATSYVPIADAPLTDQAAVVIEGTVVATRAQTASGRPRTEHTVRVESVLKGSVAGDTVRVQVLGGDTQDGASLRVWGAPALAVGDRTVLFLNRAAGGAYQPLHLSLGVFHRVEVDGVALAVRDPRSLAELEVADGASDEEAGRARDLERFRGWVADRAAGRERPADYFATPQASGVKSIVEKFTYLGGVKQRWFEFDSGTSVSWRAHAAGQEGVPGGGFAEFQAAIAAWNGDTGSNVRYRYDGTTNTTTGFSRFDGENVILFHDEHDDASGTFDCASGGVLAVGGTWYSSGGGEPRRIVGADIVINDGSSCWFTTPKRAEQVYGHELGHTLGLGHSCGDTAGVCDPVKGDALMRANAHSDNRGARLNADDQDGIRSLYPAAGGGGGGGGSKPAAPSGLSGTASSSTAVRLAWVDNATDETSYRIEMKTGTQSFKEVQTLGANVTSATLGGLTPGTTYGFRVRARNGKGYSSYSNEVTVKTLGGVPAAPAGLAATPLSTTTIRLTWQDRSTTEQGFVVQRMSPASAFATIATLPANSTQLDVTGLAPDTPYSFRVRATAPAGLSPFSPVATAATLGSSSACVAGGKDLCLLGGRFRVSAHWRNATAGTHGVATATTLPQSDQTGLFWFFDKENIELIVKVLDGKSLTGFYWTFYGGLTTLDHWIIVRDTATGATKTYFQPRRSTEPCGGADTRSLPASATAPFTSFVELQATEPLVTAASSCAPGTLCLGGGRFQVAVTWKRPDTGATGVGTPAPLNDGSGLFWFFDGQNIELVTKIVDGRTLNGKFWFFYGALTGVEYHLEVTDLATGVVRKYHEPAAADASALCGGADTRAFAG
jgi:hypothetical protein